VLEPPRPTDAVFSNCSVSRTVATSVFESRPGGQRLRENRGVVDLRQTVVFRWLAAGDSGELDAFDELLHADATIHAPSGLSTESAEAEKTVWREALAAMPGLRHDVREVVVDGDVEMARVVVTGTMERGFAGAEGTGRAFRIDQAVITHLRDGRIDEAWEIADIAALRDQVGGRAEGPPERDERERSS
jgi:predicted ester cyclase